MNHLPLSCFQFFISFFKGWSPVGTRCCLSFRHRTAIRQVCALRCAPPKGSNMCPHRALWQRRWPGSLCWASHPRDLLSAFLKARAPHSLHPWCPSSLPPSLTTTLLFDFWVCFYFLFLWVLFFRFHKWNHMVFILYFVSLSDILTLYPPGPTELSKMAKQHPSFMTNSPWCMCAVVCVCVHSILCIHRHHAHAHTHSHMYTSQLSPYGIHLLTDTWLACIAWPL